MNKNNMNKNNTKKNPGCYGWVIIFRNTWAHNGRVITYDELGGEIKQESYGIVLQQQREPSDIVGYEYRQEVHYVSIYWEYQTKSVQSWQVVTIDLT